MKSYILDPLADLNIDAHHITVQNWIRNYFENAEISVSFYNVKNKFLRHLKLVGWNLKLFIKNPKFWKCEIWPNVDLISLIFLCIRVNLRSQVKYYVRFIGIQERILIEKLPQLMKLLLKVLTRNGQCAVAAESAYLHKLFKSWGINSSYLPFPPPHISATRDFKKQPYAFFPGNPRIDKGTEKLPMISEVLAKANLNLVVNSNTASYLKAIAGKKIKNIKVISNKISNKELSEIIAMSTFVVLPYDVSVYKYRGSGFISWAIFSKSTVIVEENSTMIHDLVEFNANYATIQNSKIQFHSGKEYDNFDAFAKFKLNWGAWFS